MRLSDEQVRVLGCLLEKQRTTPDVYPLSLNALRLACSQSTNRDPVAIYDDATIRDALHGLERRGLACLASGAGSRAPKYRHLLDEALPLASDERAVMCTLMLRGAQTPGELKQRGERMHRFADLASVQRVLDTLIERELVAALPRRAGHKEQRYTHTLGDRETGTERSRDMDGAVGASERRDPGSGALEQRVARLEQEVAELRELLRAGEREPPEARALG